MILTDPRPAPRAAQAIPPLSPAYFLPASSSVLRLFVCLDVAADEIFTRHKRPTPQICPPPVVISDNNFFHSALFCPTLPPFHSPVRFACPPPLFLSSYPLSLSFSRFLQFRVFRREKMRCRKTPSASKSTNDPRIAFFSS